MLTEAQPDNVIRGNATPPNSKAPFHILSRKQKWNLVFLVSLAGCFSPLSSNIYFPAMDSISADLGISSSLVALTVTVYMIVQGIAPSLFAPIADSSGRRVAFLISVSTFTAANLGLCFTSSYPMLMALRGLQAAGSSATISISAGVIADIACPEERGGFMGVNAGIRMSGQAVGPIIGGALNSAWGFRSIFWFLLVLGVLVLSALFIILPETQRSIAGNGSIPLSGVHVPLAYFVKPPRAWGIDQSGDEIAASPANKRKGRPMTIKSAFAPLAYILEKDIAVLLAWGAIAYTAWSMVTSSTTETLLNSFPDLTSWQIGLCFFPNGFGCVAGSLCTGWMMDQSFRGAELRYRHQKGLSATDEVKHNRDFPMVRARLRLMPLCSMTLTACLALYGPSYELNDLYRYNPANLAVPLILQFIIAFSATAIFNMNSTLLIDCFPDRPASATALNNLCRCLLGAAGVSAIQPLINALKPTKAFAIVAGTVVAGTVLVWVEWKWGEEWKCEREERLAAVAAAAAVASSSHDQE